MEEDICTLRPPRFFLLPVDQCTWCNQETYDLAQEYVETFAMIYTQQENRSLSCIGCIGNTVVYVCTTVYNRSHYEMSMAYVRRFINNGHLYDMKIFDRDLYLYAMDYIHNKTNKYNYYIDLNDIKVANASNPLSTTVFKHNSDGDANGESLNRLQVSLRNYDYNTYRFLDRYLDKHHYTFFPGAVCGGGLPYGLITDIDVLRLGADIDSISAELRNAELELKKAREEQKNDTLTRPIQEFIIKVNELSERLEHAKNAYENASASNLMEMKKKYLSGNASRGGRLSRKKQVKQYKRRNSRK